MKFRVDVGPLGQLVREQTCVQVTFSNKDEVIKLSPLRSHVFHKRLRGRKMLWWSVWHEMEAQTIFPVGPAKSILLQGHCKIVKSNILLRGSDGIYLEIQYNGTFDLKSKREPTQWNNKTGVKLSYQITCITFTKHLFNSSAGGQTVVLFC